MLYPLRIFGCFPVEEEGGNWGSWNVLQERGQRFAGADRALGPFSGQRALSGGAARPPAPTQCIHFAQSAGLLVRPRSEFHRGAVPH